MKPEYEKLHFISHLMTIYGHGQTAIIFRETSPTAPDHMMAMEGMQYW